MKKPRKKVETFEVKRVTLTTYAIIEADPAGKGGRLPEFLIPNKDEHNRKVRDRLREIIGGNLSSMEGRVDDVDCMMVVNDNGKLIGLPMNEAASELRHDWLVEHAPQVDADYHSLIVGNVAIEVPDMGFEVINRDLNRNEIIERIANLSFKHPVQVASDRVYCLHEEDATVLALTLRVPKRAA